MNKKSSPWAWVPSLYFAEGIPYVIVMTVSVILYKRMGISNTDIALYTGWLYLPWVIKPFWSPFVDLVKTKRWWIVGMQLLIGAALACVALTIPAPDFFRYTLAFLWLIAFSSATHDIAADGFYMLGLDSGQQSFFVGIRSTFYRIAMITGQGLLIILAGQLEASTGLEPMRITVNATTDKEAVYYPSPSGQTTANRAQTFVVNTSALNIPIKNIDKNITDSLASYAKASNEAIGVIPKEVKTAVEPSWWSVHVSDPLGAFLKEKFGRVQPNYSKQKGNIGIITVRLLQKPPAGEEIVLNTDQTKGDNGIKLITGERLTFTDKNWNKEALLLFQIDPNITASACAEFTGRSGNIPFAWQITIGIIAILFLALCVYHYFRLPKPDSDKAVRHEDKNFWNEFFRTFGSFFSKKYILPALGFILLFRLGEAQLVKMASPFLLDSRDLGGLGISTSEVGLVYGTFGVLALVFGGILGGILISRKGLKAWILPMTLAINIPHLSYVYLSYAMPENMAVIALCVAIEQFGYGFGFTAYTLFLIYFAEGENKTAHYAICTGFMALGMMIPGMVSGWIQSIVGYEHFFVWILICALPTFLLLKFLPIDPDFGKKKE